MREIEKRTVEFTLGILGGIFGFLGAGFILFFGSIYSSLGGKDASILVSSGWAAVLFAILGITGAALVKNKAKLGGAFMIISAIGGIISISFMYALSFVLLLIAGIMAILRKD